MNNVSVFKSKLFFLLLVVLLTMPLLGYGAKKQGGKLTVPIITPAFIKNFNPLTNPDNIKGIMFEPLVIYNTMTGKIDYRLAESFSYSKDIKKIIYKLRKGMKWSDGEKITADDVVFSFNLAKKYPAFDAGGLFSSKKILSVEKSGEYEFTVNLAQKDTTAEWYMPNYFILPEHIWKNVKDPATFKNENPVGSGPLTEVTYVKSQQMEICRNPNYYLKGRPYLDCIVFRSFNDNSQIQPALMNDEIDWGSNFIADIEKTYVNKDKKNNHYWYPANDAIHIYLNTRIKPFNDIHFRKAFSMAMDREAITELAAYGYPTPNDFPGGIGNYFETYIDPKLKEKYKYLVEYNPKEARKILEAAGYKDTDGDKFYENPDGSKLEFKIMVVNGWTDWVQSVQMVTEFLADIGIKATIDAVDWGVYDGSLKKGDYQAAINWSLVSIDPIQTYYEYFHSSRIGKIWHASHGFHLRKLDKLLDEYGQIKDKKRKSEILVELQSITAENLPFISLFSNATWFQYSTKKIEGWPNAKNPYVHPVWYDTGKRLILFNELYLK